MEKHTHKLRAQLKSKDVLIKNLEKLNKNSLKKISRLTVELRGLKKEMED